MRHSFTVAFSILIMKSLYKTKTNTKKGYQKKIGLFIIKFIRKSTLSISSRKFRMYSLYQKKLFNLKEKKNRPSDLEISDYK